MEKISGILQEAVAKTQKYDTIEEAFLAAQPLMKNAELDGDNPHFKSKYATLRSVYEAVKAPLWTCGITIGHISWYVEGGEGVSIETVLTHAPSKETKTSGAINIKASTPHQVMAAITYAKRGGICMVCGIAADEDADGNDSGRGVVSDAMRGVVFSEGYRDRIVSDIDSCFTLDGKDLVCVEGDALDGLVDEMQKAGADFKLAVWEKLPSKVRTYIKQEYSE